MSNRITSIISVAALLWTSPAARADGKAVDTREISSNAWAMSQLDHFYSSKACNSPKNLSFEFEQLRAGFEERLDSLDEDLTESLVEQEQVSENSYLFFDISRDYWPILLPKSFPGRRIYSACGVHLMELEESLSKKMSKSKRFEKLETWETCIRSNYNEKVPQHTQKLIDCYKTAIKSSK